MPSKALEFSHIRAQVERTPPLHSYVWVPAVTGIGAPEAGELAIVRTDRVPGEGVEAIYSERGVALVGRPAGRANSLRGLPSG